MKCAILSVLTLLLLIHGRGDAVETPVPASSGMEYTVTLKRVEFFNETTGLWVTACDTAGTFDIASAQAGAEIAGLVADLALPAGSYSRIRITISNRFRIKAFVMAGVQGRCTGGSAVVGNNTFAATVGCSSIAGAAPVTVAMDFSSAVLSNGTEAVGSDLRATHEITPFTMGLGSGSKTAEISFRLHNVIKHYSANHFGPGSPEAIAPGQPEMTQTLE